MRTRVKSPPRPRTVIVRPSPLSRSIEMPGMRCSDSARLASGKSAMSSAFHIQRALQGGAVARDDHGLDLIDALGRALVLRRRRFLGEGLTEARADDQACRCEQHGARTGAPWMGVHSCHPPRIPIF
jgi:hypothetical protein